METDLKVSFLEIKEGKPLLTDQNQCTATAQNQENKDHLAELNQQAL